MKVSIAMKPSPSPCSGMDVRWIVESPDAQMPRVYHFVVRPLPAPLISTRIHVPSGVAAFHEATSSSNAKGCRRAEVHVPLDTRSAAPNGRVRAARQRAAKTEHATRRDDAAAVAAREREALEARGPVPLARRAACRRHQQRRRPRALRPFSRPLSVPQRTARVTSPVLRPPRRVRGQRHRRGPDDVDRALRTT